MLFFVRIVCRSLCALLLLYPSVSKAETAQTYLNSFDNAAATIFAYTIISDQADAQGALPPEQFQEHVQAIISGHYNVMALPDLLQAIQAEQSLPQNSIAITFDNAHTSILDNAVPLLEQHKLPYTIFIAPENASDNNPQYLKWKALKHLQKSGLVTFGIHTQHYEHLPALSHDALRQTLNGAIAAFQREMGARPAYFSYPYGQTTQALKDSIANAGFAAAFGQQSALIYHGSDPFYLPRFYMTESYGNRERFDMAVHALPFPVSDITPDVSVIDQNPPTLGFTLDPSMIPDKENISCFGSGQGKATIEFLGESRVEVRFDHPFESDRIRINCTLEAGKTENGQPIWRWLGTLYHLHPTATLEDGAIDR